MDASKEMTAILLGLLFGFAVAELFWRLPARRRARAELAAIAERLYAFNAAQGDAARQQALIASGLTTLRFSLFWVAVTLATITGAMLAPSCLSWSAGATVSYSIAATVSATVWWLRRAQTSAR